MNRRRFLVVSATGLVASGCSSLHDAADRRRPGSGPALRLSTSSIHFKGLSVEAALARIGGLGFDAVDIWGAYEQCPHLDDVLQRLGPTGLRSLLTAHHLALCGFSTYVGGYPKYADLLGQAGGGVAIQGGPGPCSPAELTAKMRAFLEELRPLAELAERNRSWLAVENHGHSLLDGLDSLRAFVDLNPYPRVGLALAPYHLQALGASVPEAIRIAGKQLLFFYAWQNAPGVGQLPGHGPTDFVPWLAALKEVDYRGFVNPFMHGHLEPEAMEAALRRAVEVVREGWRRA